MMQRYDRMKGKLLEKDGVQNLDDDIYFEQHLRPVAEEIEDWEIKADLLGLSLQNVSDLKDKYDGDSCNFR